MPFPSWLSDVPLLKRLLPSAMRRYHRWLGRAFVLQHHGGLTLLLRTDALIDRRLLCWGAYEAAQLAALEPLIRRYRPSVMLDIGSCWGFYALKLGRLGIFSQLHCFEPDAHNLAQLRANLLLNDWLDRVTVHPVALSDHSGEMLLQARQAGNTGHKTLIEAAVPGAEDAATVPVRRLDECLAFEGVCLFIKLDVEGHEIAALNGMEAILRQNHGIVQVEAFAANRPQVFALLEAAGYRHQHTIGDDHLFLRAPGQRVGG